MRTNKHKLVLNLEQETKLLEILKAYQLEKNYFSDMLNGYFWNSGVNFWQGCSYREIKSFEALWLNKIMFQKILCYLQELGNLL